MAYKATNAGKLMNHLESTAIEWLTQQVCDYYEVDSVLQLDKEQVEEIHVYNENERFDPYVNLALRNIIERWSEEYEDEDYI